MLTTRRPHKEIALRPSRGALTKVASQEEKEYYKEREFRILDALQALREGKLPTNDQALEWIEYMQRSGWLETAKPQLSSDGRKLFGHLSELMDTMKRVVTEKNKDERIQEFLFHTRLATEAGLKESRGTGIGGIPSKDQAQMREAMNAASTMGRLLVTNQKFRDILGDIFEIVEDIFGRQSASMKQKIRGQPSDDQQYGSYGGMGEQGYGGDRDGYGSRGDDYSQRYNTMGYGGRYGDSQYDQDRSRGNSGQDSSEERGLVPRAAGALAAYGSQIPQEKIDQLVQKLKETLMEIASNEEFQSSLDYIIDTVSDLMSRGGGLLGRGFRQSRRDANVLHATMELKGIIEDFANGHSLNPLFDAIYEMYMHYQKDVFFKTYIDEVREFIYRSIKDPEFLGNPNYDGRARVLIERGRDIMTRNYQRDTDRLVREMNGFMTAYSSDPVTTALAENMRHITNDLMYDSEGNMTFKAELFNDFRNVILPALVKELRFIAIPRIEHRDPNIDLILDNIIVTSDNFLPNVFEVKMENAAILSPRNEIQDEYTHTFTLNTFQIQADVRDVSFFYRKKTGFPRMSDHGVADFTISGQGITVLTTVQYNRWDPHRTLIPRKVQCRVDELNVNIHHSNHDTLYKFAGGMIKGTLRKAIARAIEDNILNWIDYADEQLTVMKTKQRSEKKTTFDFTRQFVPGFMRRGAAEAQKGGSKLASAAKRATGRGQDRGDRYESMGAKRREDNEEQYRKPRTGDRYEFMGAQRRGQGQEDMYPRRSEDEQGMYGSRRGSEEYGYPRDQYEGGYYGREQGRGGYGGQYGQGRGDYGRGDGYRSQDDYYRRPSRDSGYGYGGYDSQRYEEPEYARM
ncbi:hypothetical protein BKA69DRAFT_1125317 [Paraphysoderma sedebokerense]|nr:hypothetical protein BKA69DRAFT_1125317 [Paraphysoderma sedebokerense]